MGQTVMITHLAKIYDLLVSAKTKVFILSSLGGMCGSRIASCILANAAKLIPGVNCFAMASDAVITAATTAATGTLVKELFHRVRGKALVGEVRPQDLAEVMCVEEQKKLFQEYLERFSAPLIDLASDPDSWDEAALEAILM